MHTLTVAAKVPAMVKRCKVFSDISRCWTFQNQLGAWWVAQDQLHRCTHTHTKPQFLNRYYINAKCAPHVCPQVPGYPFGDRVSHCSALRHSLLHPARWDSTDHTWQPSATRMHLRHLRMPWRGSCKRTPRTMRWGLMRVTRLQGTPWACTRSTPLSLNGIVGHVASSFRGGA